MLLKTSEEANIYIYIVAIAFLIFFSYILVLIPCQLCLSVTFIPTTYFWEVHSETNIAVGTERIIFSSSTSFEQQLFLDMNICMAKHKALPLLISQAGV